MVLLWWINIGALIIITYTVSGFLIMNIAKIPRNLILIIKALHYIGFGDASEYSFRTPNPEWKQGSSEQHKLLLARVSDWVGLGFRAIAVLPLPESPPKA